MKRYLGIFILTVVVCLSCYTSNADNDTQVSYPLSRLENAIRKVPDGQE